MTDIQGKISARPHVDGIEPGGFGLGEALARGIPRKHDGADSLDVTGLDCARAEMAAGGQRKGKE